VSLDNSFLEVSSLDNSALAALATTETETRFVVSPRLVWAAARFARIVGFVKRAAALAFHSARLRSQININLQQ
jgi:hypothetical protein